MGTCCRANYSCMKISLSIILPSLIFRSFTLGNVWWFVSQKTLGLVYYFAKKFCARFRFGHGFAQLWWTGIPVILNLIFRHKCFEILIGPKKYCIPFFNRNNWPFLLQDGFVLPQDMPPSMSLSLQVKYTYYLNFNVLKSIWTMFFIVESRSLGDNRHQNIHWSH